MTVSRGLSPHSAAGINPAHAVPLFGFFIILRNAQYFNRKKHRLLCVLLRFRRGNFSGWRDCRSIYHTDNGFCLLRRPRGDRARTVHNSFGLPPRSKSPFPKGSSTQSPALSRSGTHTGGVFPAPKQSNPLQTRTLQGIESSCPLLKKQIKNKYFSCLLFLTTTSNTATIIKHILTK